MDAVAGAGHIRAAGGLVVRDDHVLLVHRPRFDDWSLPKGKLKRGEHPLAGAVREVHEETGVVGVPSIRLPTASYEVWSGGALVEKRVDYWAMRIGSVEGFTAGDEVDRIAWLPVARALSRVTYPRDALVLRAFSGLPPLGAPVVLLRDAGAADPPSGPGSDDERPLDAAGSAQAAALGRLLGLFEPRRLLSARSLRCRQTLADLARRLGIEVEMDARFEEDADPALAAAALRSFAAAATTVVCGQGRLVPAAVLHLSGHAGSGHAQSQHSVAPGEALVLSFAGDGTLVAADPVSPAPA